MSLIAALADLHANGLVLIITGHSRRFRLATLHDSHAQPSDTVDYLRDHAGANLKVRVTSSVMMDTWNVKAWVDVGPNRLIAQCPIGPADYDTYKALENRNDEVTTG